MLFAGISARKFNDLIAELIVCGMIGSISSKSTVNTFLVISSS